MIANVLHSIRIDEIDLQNCWFNPGCAMSIYKPELIRPMLKLLQTHFAPVKLHTLCCQHDPGLPPGAVIINNCAGCDRRFRWEYPGIRTISYWEVLDSLPGAALPDHSGLTVSVHDSCSYRQKPQVHAAVRSVLRKMNIRVVDARLSGARSVCCGDKFYSLLPDERVEELQRNRAAQMPCEDVVVYCIGCVRSMTVGGKRPRYLPDLVFGRETPPMTNTLTGYHNDLENYIRQH